MKSIQVFCCTMTHIVLRPIQHKNTAYNALSAIIYIQDLIQHLFQDIQYFLSNRDFANQFTWMTKFGFVQFQRKCFWRILIAFMLY